MGCGLLKSMSSATLPSFKIDEATDSFSLKSTGDMGILETNDKGFSYI